MIAKLLNANVTQVYGSCNDSLMGELYHKHPPGGPHLVLGGSSHGSVPSSFPPAMDCDQAVESIGKTIYPLVI